jgi:hypothetical protein
MDIKNDLHKIIDTIEDHGLLKSMYDLLEMTKSNPGEIWSSLSDHERRAVLDAENRTQTPNSHVIHDEMVRRNKQWLQE